MADSQREGRSARRLLLHPGKDSSQINWQSPWPEVGQSPWLLERMEYKEQ